MMPESKIKGKNDNSKSLGGENRYQQTLMYGRYSEALGDYAREEAERQRVSEKGGRARRPAADACSPSFGSGTVVTPAK